MTELDYGTSLTGENLATSLGRLARMTGAHAVIPAQPRLRVATQDVETYEPVVVEEIYEPVEQIFEPEPVEEAYEPVEEAYEPVEAGSHTPTEESGESVDESDATLEPAGEEFMAVSVEVIDAGPVEPEPAEQVDLYASEQAGAPVEEDAFVPEPEPEQDPQEVAALLAGFDPNKYLNQPVVVPAPPVEEIPFATPASAGAEDYTAGPEPAGSPVTTAAGDEDGSPQVHSGPRSQDEVMSMLRELSALKDMR